MPWNGWQPCAPMSPTRMSRWFVTNGYYSNVSRGSRKKQNQDGLVPCIPQPDEPSRGYRKNWARFTVYPPLAGPSDRFALVCDTLQQQSLVRSTIRPLSITIFMCLTEGPSIRSSVKSIAPVRSRCTRNMCPLKC
jgi:hypothetical protein